MSRMLPPARTGWLQRLATFALRHRQGKVSDTIGVLGHHPRILAAFLSCGAFFESSHKLPARLKRLVHLRVAMRVGCPS